MRLACLKVCVYVCFFVFRLACCVLAACLRCPKRGVRGAEGAVLNQCWRRSSSLCFFFSGRAPPRVAYDNLDKRNNKHNINNVLRLLPETTMKPRSCTQQCTDSCRSCAYTNSFGTCIFKLLSSCLWLCCEKPQSPHSSIEC